MRYLLPLVTLFFIASDSNAQAEPTPSWLIGTEVQLYFADLPEPRGTLGYGYGLHVEKPLGRWSLGTGIQQQQFGWHQSRQFNGEFVPGTGDDPDTYGYWFQDRKVALLNIPLRLQYRLPCNCVYLQAAVVNSFLRTGSAFLGDGYVNYLNQAPPEPFAAGQPLPTYSLGYELGVGLNFHLSQNWKLYTRLIYSQYAFNQIDLGLFPTLSNGFLGLNLGLQRALY